MFDEVQSEAKERVNPVPDESIPAKLESSESPVPADFMPYSCTELDKGLIEYARKYLNETEETKKKSLEEVKEFIKRELDVHYEPKDLENILLCFLRSRKFDVKRTCSLMKKGTEFVESYKAIFDRHDPEVVRRAIESKTVGFLPYRDSKGRALVLVRAECWDPEQLKADDLIFGCMVALHVAGENPVNQVAGFVVIVDFKNLSIHHALGMSNWLIFGIQALQRCCPCMVKEFHVVHTPGIVRACWKIVKPLLSEKIKKRITFYKSAHWESLHRKIPPCILPEELGGELGPYSFEHWAGDITAVEKKYYDRCHNFINRRNTN